jgi:hypothetical protein
MLSNDRRYNGRKGTRGTQQEDRLTHEIEY